MDKLINLAVLLPTVAMLMSFVASAGGRIGGLGVKLVREIKIEVKNED